jgi:ubiquinone/menaquinone biosynthesis C-methylase UbiE
MSGDVGQPLPPANPEFTNVWQAKAPAPLFDCIATRYDALWTDTAIGRAQRNLVWRSIDGFFHAGDRILDIGCGTGEDAAHFAARGIRVYATDASPAMVQVARERGIAATVCNAEELGRIGRSFDGAISNFGALNCVENLPAVAVSLAALVRPGGQVAICLMGRFCAWETLYYSVCLQWSKAFRRSRGAQYHGIAIHYPTVAEVRTSFAPDFELRRWTGIGLLVPPSYVKLPTSVVHLLAACDRILARLPLLRGMADHRLFLLVRK